MTKWKRCTLREYFWLILSLIMTAITVIILCFWTSPLTSLSEKMNNIEVYERNELKGMRSQMNWTPGKLSLPLGTVFRMRSLKLQRKWQKGHRGGVGRVWLPSNSVNINNNITVPKSDFHDGKVAELM